MDFSRSCSVLITCARGLTPYLEQEMTSLEFPILSRHKTGLVTNASLNDTLRLNLNLSTAYNVLYLLKEFNAQSSDDLYRETGTIDWDDIIPDDEYVSIVAHTHTPVIRNSLFAAQKTKDAIVDQLARRRGKRPDSGPKKSNIVIHLYWEHARCWLYLNTSGRKLSDRNWRKNPYKAPMQETLAAGVIMATGYDGTQPFVNPMCGSGTIAIEAALRALTRPAGSLRDNFGFMHIRGFQRHRWDTLRAQVIRNTKKILPAPIIATDIDQNAIEAARNNAQTAGVAHLIEFKICDVADTPIPPGNGIVIVNPEYGQRLGKTEDLAAIYKRLGDFFKQRCNSYACYIFTGNNECAKKVGLRSNRRLTFFNAQIECRLLRYEMYSGSKNFKIRGTVLPYHDI
ncbi:MAG: class I SAM-dependent RNA methyltransferase [Candidatus Omnitrophota bacterium]